MKALLISDDREKIVEYKDIEDIQELPLAPGEVLTKVLFSSLCHSDLHVAENGNQSNFGLSVGHESIHKIIRVGDHVTNLEVGDYVAFPAGLHDACGTCKFCLKGEEVFCENAVFTTSPKRGGTMQEYTIESADFCTKVSANVDLGKACIITCAGITVYKGLKIANLKPGEFVAIYGIGGLGNVAIEYAKNVFNAKVIAVGSNPESLKIAKSKGADYVINWKETNLVEEINKITDNQGVDVALVTSSTATLYKQLFNTVSRLGRIIPIGISNETIEMGLPDLVLNGKQILGSLIGTRKDLEESLQALYDGKVNPEFEYKPLSHAPKYFKLMQEFKLHKRIVFDCSK
ncbi:zinc-binding dehydrogenase [Mesoplasma coleopterae]|uniref:Alcohol dehydrogenase n=1 Tax=Mesoplasma coleopterae TaxID=324078 RepID=A0A2K8P1T4_9MOLU|nr:zinc-binding dehydrogenase [Mesoplasma coleopterae]ATZ20717.1 zinc-dependent alcohol dehydrogenase [Mesoplasma coleopterae]